GVPALFYQKSIKGHSSVLVDPAYLSKKDHIRLLSYDVSGDSRYLAYQFSRNGSDWCEVKVVGFKSGNHLDDHLTGLKFSDLAWRGDGFYYSTFAPSEGLGPVSGQKVFYHQLGTDQSEDLLVFTRKNPQLFFDFLTTEDERFFILTETNEATGSSNTFFIDFASPFHQLRPLYMKVPSEKKISIIGNRGDQLIGVTDGRVVSIDYNQPAKLIALTAFISDAVLVRAIPMDDRVLMIYRRDQRPILAVSDYKENMLFTLEFPVASSINGFHGYSTDDELLFYLSSYTLPPVVYKFNINTFERELQQRTEVAFDHSDIHYTEVGYPSGDGTVVPMILVHQGELKRDGHPVILETYGGFGVIENPSFDAGIVHFIQSGGIYAFASIRGGGDKGKSWANAGKGLNKQTSFDDFIAAAEFLIEEGYTTPGQLAITGASNGGLVVAAAAVQRPDLFKVVVPEVAPLDMLRFERFTVGHFHIDEYGSVSTREGFENLLGYSPYHNIRDEVNYPAMMVLTSENDDRVPPLHSYKFVARLQNRAAQTNPVILKVRQGTGHSSSGTMASNVRERAEKYGFMMSFVMD
ncbi:MAG: prolyl oligopeptidase family serine peptidase, partial [Saprospiraceae bacterium]|nr:prolyl oligopeptidase family serine peptidase [Saprospiraceae bacterium]